MDNKHPKKELPVIKEKAALAKQKQGLDKSTAQEKSQRTDSPEGAPRQRGRHQGLAPH